MEETAHVTCFGFKQSKSGRHKTRQKTHHSRAKTAPPLNISPLSSMNSDEAIKAHRIDLVQDARTSCPQQVDAPAELSRERALRQSLEEQLATALNVNAEMKLALSLRDEDGDNGLLAKKLARLRGQLGKERKDREEAEMQLAASKREAAAMRAALNAARSQRDNLEAELMEAALDVMDSEKQRANLETAMKNEKRARQMAEEAVAECEMLRHKLKCSENAKTALEERMEAMTHEARDWEMALDALQERLECAILNKPLESIAVGPLHLSGPPTPSPDTEQIFRMDSAKASGGFDGELTGARSLELTQPESPANPASPSKPEPWRQVVVKRPIIA